MRTFFKILENSVGRVPFPPSNKMVRLGYLFILSSMTVATMAAFQYQTKYIEQKVDHFSYTNDDTYSQRYLISHKHWVAGGPILFYAGNEGGIVTFANNTGIMWYWAPYLKAMVVFGEHRFYGESLPYGSEAYTNLSHLGYLTSQQALADFAILITHLKESIEGASNSPVIVFGGSYGGQLAAYFRMKYPHIVDGALASSAPVLTFPGAGMAPCYMFPRSATNMFKRESEECVRVIRKSWGIIRNLSLNDSGREFLSKTFGLCNTLNTSNDVDAFVSFLSNIWGNAAMTNYPYPTNFLAPIPGHPVMEMCKLMNDSSKSDHDLMVDLFLGATVFQNYTGQTACFNTSMSDNPDIGDIGWDFQVCSELVSPYCNDNVHDMFESSPWNLSSLSAYCRQTYNVTPDINAGAIEYGGRKIAEVSNIIFSNGLLDPWHLGGILQLPANSSEVHVIVIPDAAHHLDLRYPNKADPPSVKKARKLEKIIIQGWINSINTSKNISNEMTSSGGARNSWISTKAILGFNILFSVIAAKTNV